MFSLALVAALSSLHTVEFDFPDGSIASVTSADKTDLRVAEYAGFMSNSASEFAEWVPVFSLAFAGGPDPTPLSQCVSQAVQTCGNGKVCWVFVQSSSCSFGCAIANAVPPCPPPPASPPLPSQAD